MALVILAGARKEHELADIQWEVDIMLRRLLQQQQQQQQQQQEEQPQQWCRRSKENHQVAVVIADAGTTGAPGNKAVWRTLKRPLPNSTEPFTRLQDNPMYCPNRKNPQHFLKDWENHWNSRFPTVPTWTLYNHSRKEALRKTTATWEFPNIGDPNLVH